MNAVGTTLHTSLSKTPGFEARHLLIEFVNGSRETKLIQMSNGSDTILDTGTEYDMTQKADALARDWKINEGFTTPKQNEYVFEPLQRTIALAMRLGFTILFDQRGKLPVTVPLNTWPGLTAKNSGIYVYAFNQEQILAWPTLPLDHPLSAFPADSKDHVNHLAKINNFLNTVGAAETFTLGKTSH
jgi:hypothetical protein